MRHGVLLDIGAASMGKEFIGKYTRDEPCVKCGGKLFYFCSGNCVACQQAANSSRTKNDKPRKARKSSEKRADRSHISAILSTRW
jgi:hypothetical protein